MELPGIAAAAACQGWRLRHLLALDKQGRKIFWVKSTQVPTVKKGGYYVAITISENSAFNGNNKKRLIVIMNDYIGYYPIYFKRSMLECGDLKVTATQGGNAHREEAL